jgi:hypothetical protein
MRRRFPFAWVLSLLLVFVQHGAVLHELGHLSHSDSASGTAVQAERHGLGSAFCPSCEGFAQIANPAACTPASLPVDPSGFIPPPDPSYGIAGADSPTPRSRGPPSV